MLIPLHSVLYSKLLGGKRIHPDRRQEMVRHGVYPVVHCLRSTSNVVMDFWAKTIHQHFPVTMLK